MTLRSLLRGRADVTRAANSARKVAFRRWCRKQPRSSPRHAPTSAAVGRAAASASVPWPASPSPPWPWPCTSGRGRSRSTSHWRASTSTACRSRPARTNESVTYRRPKTSDAVRDAVRFDTMRFDAMHNNARRGGARRYDAQCETMRSAHGECTGRGGESSHACERRARTHTAQLGIRQVTSVGTRCDVSRHKPFA